MDDPERPARGDRGVGIRIEAASNITIRNARMSGLSRGVVVGPEAKNVTIEGLETTDVDIAVSASTDSLASEATTALRPATSRKARRVWVMGRVPWHKDDEDD